MKVYTKTGDGGTTSLIGGERVSKADPRVEAYGTVDELAAQIALLADMMDGSGEGRFAPVVAATRDIQKELMTVEALLATGRGGEGKVPPLPEGAIRRLESEIDDMSDSLPPLRGFTLPGGDPIVSQCHVCRTVCRRAERAVIRAASEYSQSSERVAVEAVSRCSQTGKRATVEAASQNPQSAGPAAYLNRLSDWLYTAGRKAVEILEVKEIYWMP